MMIHFEAKSQTGDIGNSLEANAADGGTAIQHKIADEVVWKFKVSHGNFPFDGWGMIRRGRCSFNLYHQTSLATVTQKPPIQESF